MIYLYIVFFILMFLDIGLTEYAIRIRGAKEINPLMRNSKVRLITGIFELFIPSILYTLNQMTGWIWINYTALGLTILYSIVVGNNTFQILK